MYCFAARPLTVFFTDEASHSSDLTGGKGSSLGKLTKLSSDMKSVKYRNKNCILKSNKRSNFVKNYLYYVISKNNLVYIVYMLVVYSAGKNHKPY